MEQVENKFAESLRIACVKPCINYIIRERKRSKLHGHTETWDQFTSLWEIHPYEHEDPWCPLQLVKINTSYGLREETVSPY